jgi:hypothetical protein
LRALRRAVLAVAVLAPLQVAGPAAAATAPAATTPTTPVVWGCRPDVTPNPCYGSLDTTILKSTTLQPRKVLRVDHPQNATNPKVDCFYVYPTVSSSLKPAAAQHMTNEVRSILNYQAARWSQQCRVFAPVYRQLTLAGIVSSSIAQQKVLTDRAYGDVLAAWKSYLANDNHGRGVVFIGHSQGSEMLIKLLSKEIDPDPALRKQVVSAIVLGGNVAVKKGQRAGGDFQNIPTCATQDEAGCLIAYSTFDKQPSSHTTFGRLDGTLRAAFDLPTDLENDEVACVSPADLSGDHGLNETYTRTEPFPGLIGLGLTQLYLGFQPKASTPWVSPGEKYRSHCVHSNGANVLMVKAAAPATILPVASPTPDWGLHLADMNLPLGNLQRVLEHQIATYAAAGDAPAAS